ncbi:MAG: hypothetical protein ACYCQK_01310 [Acidiferrobacteraceae bacterium]
MIATAPNPARVKLGFDEYRHHANEADALLWEAREIIGDGIAWGTGGDFSHISMAVRINGRLWSAAYREHMNGYVTPLAGEVRRNPGMIAVFRPNLLSRSECGEIARFMLNTLDGDYSWSDISLDAETIFAQKLPWLTKAIGLVPGLGAWYRNRVLQHHREAERLSQLRTSADCSQAYVRALRLGARKIILTNKLDAEATPNDIAAAPDMIYLGHLTWPKRWRR